MRFPRNMRGDEIVFERISVPALLGRMAKTKNFRKQITNNFFVDSYDFVSFAHHFPKQEKPGWRNW